MAEIRLFPTPPFALENQMDLVAFRVFVFCGCHVNCSFNRSTAFEWRTDRSLNPSDCFFSRCSRTLRNGSGEAGDWDCGSALDSAAARGVVRFRPGAARLSTPNPGHVNPKLQDHHHKHVRHPCAIYVGRRRNRECQVATGVKLLRKASDQQRIREYNAGRQRAACRAELGNVPQGSAASKIKAYEMILVSLPSPSLFRSFR